MYNTVKRTLVLHNIIQMKRYNNITMSCILQHKTAQWLLSEP